MSYNFSPKRAAQAAAVMLKEADRCEMSYMKLLKLLYIADRESIAEQGAPITGDRLVAMPHGPVLSTVYDYIMQRDADGADMWNLFIETDGVSVRLIDDPGESKLSRYALGKLKAVSERYKDFDQWELRQITHGFPEWIRNNPGHSSSPIPLQHIVDAVGCSADLDDIVQEREEAHYFARLFDDKSGN